MRKYNLLFIFSIVCITMYGREYHVSPQGNDINNGNLSSPFKTIQAAANKAYPGDTITVHSGTYREWINPLRGGISNNKRIVYRAAPGEKVEIKGSERITSWKKVKNGVWKVELPDSFFGVHNPYKEEVSGDWMIDGMICHTGEVFLNGTSLYETDSLSKVLNPKPLVSRKDPDGTTAFWYCESNDDNTTIWAHFGQFNPNKELTEISMRPTCFYPEAQRINYLTISGFHFSQAATQWASPTGEQVGMIATHWNKGWIIENNIISNSKCAGITLGKERSTGHNLYLENKDKESSLHYTGTQYYTEVIFNTLRHGWNKENIGSHIVRNNIIYNCEEAGICGSMGAAFCEISNNHIYNIWVKQQFNGFEIAGIKFHGAIDTKINNNRINSCGAFGIWLDWMSQGSRVSSNLFYNNSSDLFTEVNHGPMLVDNNLLLSHRSIDNMSEGGAYVHNLIAGQISTRSELTRYTPYHLPHSTEIAGFSLITGGDDRFYNNLFIPAKPEKGDKNKEMYGLTEYNKTTYPSYADGNVYYNQAIPFEGEKKQLVLPDFNPQLKIEIENEEIFLSFQLKDIEKLQTEIITTEKLDTPKLPKALYEQPDGNPISITTDYAGNKRGSQPKPGPLESIKEGSNKLKVW